MTRSEHRAKHVAAPPAQTISVALCTYNASRFLAEQLRSIFRQTRRPDEIVVVDDASADDTCAIVERLAPLAPCKVRLERQPRNTGWVNNASRAVELCTSTLVALCDHDDVWHPEKLARAAAAFAAQPSLRLTFHHAELVDERMITLGRRSLTDEERLELANGPVFPLLVRYNLAQGASMVFMRADWDWIKPVPPTVAFDAFVSLCLAAAGEVRYLDEPLLLYRQHDMNLLGVDIGGGPAWILRRFKEARARAGTHLPNQIEKLAAARARVAAAGMAPQPVLELLDEKVRHLELRAKLPSIRLARVPQIGGEVASGRYHRLSRGIASAFRDFIV